MDYTPFHALTIKIPVTSAEFRQVIRFHSICSPTLWQILIGLDSAFEKYTCLRSVRLAHFNDRNNPWGGGLLLQRYCRNCHKQKISTVQKKTVITLVMNRYHLSNDLVTSDVDRDRGLDAM